MKVTFTIPEGMHEVSIAKYRDLEAAMAKEKSDIGKVCAAVGVLCDVDPNYVKGMSGRDFNRIAKDLEWAMDKSKEDWELIPTTFIHGTEYGFIPDLSDLTVGEFADLDKLVSKGNAFDRLEEVMAILYRPVTGKWKDFYDIEEYDPKPKDKEVMKAMTMDVALGAVVFFWSIAEQLANDLAPSSGRRRSPVTQTR